MVLILGLLLVVNVCVLAVLLLQFRLNIKRYHASQGQPSHINRLDDTPTISLCIPARNETHALEDCLQSAIASDYPKLEIIVLDDCSQDRTSQIIRGFAHDGVRFVHGEAPAEGWLGKNNAYDTLVNEARGDYLVFMSVDTRLEPGTLSKLLSYMQTTKLSMVSVLPRRPDSWRASVIFSPLRYFWQMVLPLKFNIPAATSLWAIQTQRLQEIGGFGQYKDRIMPENDLAKALFAKQEYRFLVADDNLAAWYEKKWQSQVDTAIRLWYPQLSQNSLLSFLAMLFHFVLFVLPLKVLAFFALGWIPPSNAWLLILAVAAWLLSMVLYFSYHQQTHRTSTNAVLSGLVTTFLVPLIGAQEAILIIVSYIQYKRGHVSWKGRNVCYPVLKRMN